MLIVKYIVCFLLIPISLSFAEERLKFSDIFLEIPSSAKKTLSQSFSKKSIPAWSLIFASTGLTYYYDENIYSSVQRKGRAWGIGNDDKTSTFVSLGEIPILRLPTDLGSAMYFLGDGWMHFGIAGGLLVAGSGANTKAFNTGIMLVHGMVYSTIFNQALKRSFGRESPLVKTKDRGAWRPFPSIKEYNSKVSTYDAMPSGHVMTLTHTITVLGEQYADHKKTIYSVGGVALTALSLQMVNNGVHWMSDYPLGIAMGYVMGKISAQMGKEESDTQVGKWIFYPSAADGVASINAVTTFF